MKISRRRFLLYCSLFSLPGIPATAFRRSRAVDQQIRPSNPMDCAWGIVMPDELSIAIFKSHLNTAFQATDPEGHAVPMKLIEVSEGPQDARLEQYSVVFQAPPDALNSQGNYQFRHPGIGAFLIFIVPIGKDAEGLYYEAVFSQLKSRD